MRAHWKKASVLIFWDSSFYYKKDPYQVWKDKTVKERKAALKKSDTINTEREKL